ncbi:MAG: potassium transporter TrkG, partial [Myxococcota bacterium]
MLRFVDVALALGYPLWVASRLLRSHGDVFARLSARRADVMFGGFVLTLLLVSSASVAGPLVILRGLAGGTVRWLGTVAGDRAARRARMRPPQTAAVGFAVLIAAGTLLLGSPPATRDGEGLAFLEALFTMTSAVTVTGLAVVPAATTLSFFGQAVVLGAMQIGAIGIMVLGAALVFALGGRLPQRREGGLRVLLEVRTGETLSRLIGAVTTTTIVAEASGTLCLYGLWWLGALPLPEEYDDAAGALWWAVFHAVSAFCNAGFSLSEHSLEDFVGNPLVCAVFAMLITVGGLGFAVLSDLAHEQRPFWSQPRWTWRRLQLQTRLVLSMTLLLDGVGFLAVLFLEFDEALAGHPLGTKLWAALFQSVSLRTAGFNTIPLEGILPSTTVLMVAWMFIGAGPGGTGGGVKVTTTATVIFAVRAMLRSRDDV